MSRRRIEPSPTASESMANALIRRHGSPRAQAALTRQQLARKTRREIPSGLDLPETEAAGAATDELLQIGRLTPLTPAMRRAYEMWVAGETTDEIAAALGMARATAARLVRRALLRCWFTGGPSFRRFSARITYRARREETVTVRFGARCEVCAAPLWEDCQRTTCGAPQCESVMRQRITLDRRRWEARRRHSQEQI